jgi:alanine racemase
MTTRPGQPIRPCWLEIDTGSLQRNYRVLDQLAFMNRTAGTDCLAIVKADAYGHGLSLCAPAAVQAGAEWLGVTSVEEGAAARAVCHKPRIVVMGGVFPGQGPALIANRLTPVIWDPLQFDELEHAAASAELPPASLSVHLEIDTGMSRQGVTLDDLPGLLARFTAASPVRLEAVMTHLYASDEANGSTTPAQLLRLEQALSIIGTTLPAAAPQPGYLSVGASAALLGGESPAIGTVAARFKLRHLLRLGLALYGVVPRFDPPFETGNEPKILTPALENLRPVLAWKTRVTSLRNIPAGAEVGYNGTFVATEPMHLALLPLGYADGLDRRLGNRFSLLVRGQRAPLVGRISMDQAVLDVTEIPGVAPGDEVVIIGIQQGETITAFDHAEAAGTIPWEIFTRIAARVPRVPCAP